MKYPTKRTLNQWRKAWFAGFTAGLEDKTANADWHHPHHTRAWMDGYWIARLEDEERSGIAWKSYLKRLRHRWRAEHEDPTRQPNQQQRR